MSGFNFTVKRGKVELVNAQDKQKKKKTKLSLFNTVLLSMLVVGVFALLATSLFDIGSGTPLIALTF